MSKPPPWDDAHGPHICLNMIVKNETKVLPRLLNSVKDVVDYYVIVDTGSTDGTIELIREIMKEYQIPGTVYERPWVNFGHNRQEALVLALEHKPDFLLFVDADEEFICMHPVVFKDKTVSGKSYDLEKHNGATRYAVPHLIDVRHGKYRWEGAVHEYLVDEGNTPREVRKDAWILCRPGEGARSLGISQKEKFLADAKLLEEDLVRDPTNARSMFYLAQSYRDAGNLPVAYSKYKQRARTEGWPEETFMAQLECGRIGSKLHTEEDVHSDLIAAYVMRPTRAESLYELAKFYRTRKQFALGALYARAGVGIERPNDRLFIDESVYQWRLLDELAVSAYWIGDYGTCASACSELLLRDALYSAQDKKRIEANLEHARARLA